MTLHIMYSVWRHDGDSISEYTLVLGGLVILARESLQGGESGPEERSEEGRTCGLNFLYHMWFAGEKITYIRGLQMNK